MNTNIIDYSNQSGWTDPKETLKGQDIKLYKNFENSSSDLLSSFYRFFLLQNFCAMTKAAAFFLKSFQKYISNAMTTSFCVIDWKVLIL